jgi:hypothetical protein
MAMDEIEVMVNINDSDMIVGQKFGKWAIPRPK